MDVWVWLHATQHNLSPRGYNLPGGDHGVVLDRSMTADGPVYNIRWVGTNDTRRDVPERLISRCACCACTQHKRACATDEREMELQKLRAEIEQLRLRNIASAVAVDLNRDETNKARKKTKAAVNTAARKTKAADRRVEAAEKERDQAVVLSEAQVAQVQRSAIELAATTRSEVEAEVKTAENKKRRSMASDHRASNIALRQKLVHTQAQADRANAGAAKAFQLRERNEISLKATQRQNRGLALTVGALKSKGSSNRAEKNKHDKARRTRQNYSKNKNRYRPDMLAHHTHTRMRACVCVCVYTHQHARSHTNRARSFRRLSTRAKTAEARVTVLLRPFKPDRRSHLPRSHVTISASLAYVKVGDTL